MRAGLARPARTQPVNQQLSPGYMGLALPPDGSFGGGAQWVDKGEATLFWVDLGDVVGADHELLPPEQTGPNFNPFGLVRRLSIADTTDATDPSRRRFNEEALAAAEPIAVAVARTGRVASFAFLVRRHELRLSGAVGRRQGRRGVPTQTRRERLARRGRGGPSAGSIPSVSSDRERRDR